MESVLLSLIFFGVLSIFVRAIVGVAKYFEKNKAEQKIRTWHLIFTLFVTAVFRGPTLPGR